MTGGVQAVIIAAGGEHEVIDKIIRGEPAGTAFFLIDNCDYPSDTLAGSDGESGVGHFSRDTSFDAGNSSGISSGHSLGDEFNAAASTGGSNPNPAKTSGKEKTKQSLTVEEIATRARDGSRQLNRVSEDLRKSILTDIASSLQSHQSEILDANAIDLEAAEKRYDCVTVCLCIFASVKYYL